MKKKYKLMVWGPGRMGGTAFGRLPTRKSLSLLGSAAISRRKSASMPASLSV